ncbi:uncharacterized protein LOC126979218 [Leptidea sinapis]|uniref:uncharacterized protein LOC126979218 n=1 Tax=Leptidea sinapis TaxID=189913 RepID=UPI0021465925|nr:uncharacterized protein LOC126979218 [Leptidea sinapis]
MWCTWIALLLVSGALGQELETTTELPVTETAGPVEVTTGPTVPVGTSRSPPRTLDRQAAELAWRTWLQSPESGNPNGPPRRITTKSLFITPLVCPKGQRLDRNGCVQVVTVNKDEHERILLDQLNALFNATPANTGDVLYDYGEEEPGPLQLSIPLGLDPQIASLQSQDPNMQIHKKGEATHISDASIEAELELLKLQQQHMSKNYTMDNTNILSHNVLNNLLSYSDKPKRDSPMTNSSESNEQNIADEGQKEIIYGQVNVDPVLYDTDGNAPTVTPTAKPIDISSNDAINNNKNESNKKETDKQLSDKETDSVKLNPENDYSDIGEAIKLISRYAEVSTDDNFNRGNGMIVSADDSILGTRTKIQYRRNKPNLANKIKQESNPSYEKDIRQIDTVYRYPVSRENARSPPENYPFKRLQDYWPGRDKFGGVYNNVHENPRRHHHSYPHYFRPRSYQYLESPDVKSHAEIYPGLAYPHKASRHNTRNSPIRSHPNDQDLYSLLGLRHWFSGEDASKR